MQSAGNGLKLNAADGGGGMAFRERPDVSAAGVDSQARTVLDSRNIPSAPAPQNLRKSCAVRTATRRPMRGGREREREPSHMMAIEMCCTSLTEYEPVLPIRSIHVLVAPYVKMTSDSTNSAVQIDAVLLGWRFQAQPREEKAPQ
jgi:hypothetical protein